MSARSDVYVTFSPLAVARELCRTIVKKVWSRVPYRSGNYSTVDIHSFLKCRAGSSDIFDKVPQKAVIGLIKM